MEQSEDSKTESVQQSVERAEPGVPFGANELRLSGRQWLATVAIVLIVVIGLPRLWTRIERFDVGKDYRIPYALSSDYWLYKRRIDGIDPQAIPVLGDSVVWGEYVRVDGTLTHFLNRENENQGNLASAHFVNCGVNGLFPLSLEGLVENYAGALHNRKVIVQCNLLWMTSPKADLSTNKEETFNHSWLVPQFSPSIPCYMADANTRLATVIGRRIDFCGWVGHIDGIYFNEQSLPRWTLAEDESDPPRYPNAWRNPLRQITFKVPGEPVSDPQRGPTSARHHAWNAHGDNTTYFDWVPLTSSLQWQAFKRTIRILQGRGDDVLVVLGPFNRHIVAEDQRATLHTLETGVTDWLSVNHVAFVVPETLPSNLYADTSHPLTDGYALLASRLYQEQTFQHWLPTR